MVAKTAAYLMNCLPTKANADFGTPYELLYGEKPDLCYQCVFGCVAWTYNPDEVRGWRLVNHIEQFPDE